MFQNLSLREKIVLAGGAAALLLIVIVFGIVLPYRSAIARLDSRIAQQENKLQEIRQLQSEYLQLKAVLSRQESKLARSDNASAFSSIENIVTRLGFRDRLVAMRPQPAGEREGMRVETVEARLEGIDLEQLIGLLEAFDTANTLLNVSSMQIRTRFDNASLIDAELQVETLKKGN